MVHSQLLNLLGRSPSVQSLLLEVMGCPIRSSRLPCLGGGQHCCTSSICLHWNDVPTMWKHSVIVPVFKTGDHSVPSNYRPISLASCCFKINCSLHLPAIAPLPGRFPLGCRHDGWLSDRRVAHAVCHPHFRCVRGHLQSIRHLLGGSDDGGVVLHGGPRAHEGLDCTFCAWDVLAGQKWCRSVRALAGHTGGA